MSIKLEFIKLNRVAEEVSSKLYDIYINYLNNDIEFPYYEVNKLVDRYESFYIKVYNKKDSGLNKLLIKMNVFGNDFDTRYNAFSKDELLLHVSEKVFILILFEANKYVPVDDDSKNVIFDKLFPVVKNLRVVDITDIYSKMKKSAIIRGFVFNENSTAMMQEMFVNFIISVLTYNSYNKFNYMKSSWTPEEICMKILKEPLMYRGNSMKRVK